MAAITRPTFQLRTLSTQHVAGFVLMADGKGVTEPRLGNQGAQVVVIQRVDAVSELALQKSVVQPCFKGNATPKITLPSLIGCGDGIVKAFTIRNQLWIKTIIRRANQAASSGQCNTDFS